MILDFGWSDFAALIFYCIVVKWDADNKYISLAIHDEICIDWSFFNEELGFLIIRLMWIGLDICLENAHLCKVDIRGSVPCFKLFRYSYSLIHEAAIMTEI